MMNFIVTIISALLILTFGLLNEVWAGFSYFSLVLFTGICIYWLVILIISYINNYIKNIDERYKFYCAQLINSTNLTSEDINEKPELYFKQFKRSLRKEKLLEIAKALVVLTILISCVSLFFSGNIF